MNLLISLIVALILIGVVWWGLNAIAAAFGLPAQATVILQVVLVLIIVVWLLSVLTGYGGIRGFRLTD